MAEQSSGLSRTEPYYKNEITLSEVLLKLWAKRGLVVLMPMIFAGMTLAGLLTSKVSLPNHIEFYIELNGISLRDISGENGETMDEDQAKMTRYPNGTIFTPQNITSPSVIRILADQTGLSGQNLAANIDAQFGTPLSNGVLFEYQSALTANSQASVQELNAINQRYEEKLSETAKRGMQITINHLALGITEEQGSQLARDLLKTWNKVYTEQFNTLLPSSVLSQHVLAEVYNLTSTVGLQEAEMQLTAVADGLAAITEDRQTSGLLNYRGRSAAEIQRYLTKFREIYFEPLFLAAFDRDDSLTSIYARDIAVQTSVIDAEINELNRRLTTIREVSSPNQGAGRDGIKEPITGMDGGAFSQMISLMEQASLSKYIQATLDERYRLVEAKSKLSARLERMQRGAANADVASGKFFSQATERYATIIDDYRDLQAKVKEEVLLRQPPYYSMVSQPRVSSDVFFERDFLFIALSTLLGFLLAALIALLQPQLLSDSQ